MKKIILLVFSFLTFSAMSAQEITGQWNGVLKTANVSLRIVIHITKTDSGYSSTMDSPDQGAKGIPVANTTFENAVLKLNIAAVGGSYEGILNSKNIIEGKLSQNGQSFDVNFSREVLENNNPLEPQKPYPYYTEEVKFENKTDNVTLAGTLSLPKKEGNYPAVILISGSGPQNRDEEMPNHKPFLVLSDYLTKKGIAVLRFDDRGVGESTGSFHTALTTDFAKDVQAGIEYLKTRKEINKNKIGLIGHSEGGLIAPIVASSSKDVAYIVLLAGPGIQGDKLLLLQKELLERKMGVSESEIQKGKELYKGAYELVAVSKSNDENFKNALKNYFQSKLNGNEKEVRKSVAEVSSPWFYNFLKLNPAEYLQKVKCPVLALNGILDLQVPAEVNLNAIKNSLTQSGNKKVTVKSMPNLNHLFQECSTGLPSEYVTIQQTMSPIALEEISNWVLVQTK